MKRKIISLILMLTMLAGVSACGSTGSEPQPTPAATETPAPEETPSATPDATPAPEETEKPGDDDAEAGTPDESPAPGAEADKPAALPEGPAVMPEQPAEGEASGGTASADAENGALAILQKAWDAYPEDNKFAAAGGDYSEEHMVDGGPGIYGIADAQQLDSVFGVPAGSVGMIDGAASLIHMLNSNTFTCGAFHIKSGEDASAFAQSLKDNILQRRWMCGFPDKVVIYSVGEYIVSAFGNAEIIDSFFSALTGGESAAVLLYDEPIE